MNRKHFGALALLFLFFFLTACGGGEEDPPVDATVPTPSPVETPEPPPELYTGPRNPLTAVPVAEEISHMRPWAVLLDNIALARPHHGISQADIIYEMPVEGGITRLLAVFQDIEGVGEIGPVRSARHYFLDVVQGHDALFVHAGGSPQAYEAIRGRGVPNIDGVLGTGWEFFRDQERIWQAGYEHSMMTTDELLLNNIDNYNYRREHGPDFHPGLSFNLTGEDMPATGQPAVDVTVRYSAYHAVGFRFHEVTGLYGVSLGSEPFIDGVTGEQIQVANVLVLFANFWVLDGEGRLGVDLGTGGDGYFINGGQSVPISWTKAGHMEPFLFTLANGEPLELAVGMSYINVVNVNTGGVTFG